MGEAIKNAADPAVKIEAWIAQVTELAEEVAGWSRAEGWAVEREPKTIDERLLGRYEVPTLLVRPPGGELFLNPIARHATGVDGRVDLEAFPTLNRVKLVAGQGGWRILTDSNVPLREPWNRATFVQLAQDLLG